MKKYLLLGTAGVLMGLTAAGTGIAAANSDDGDVTVSSPLGQRAVSAALAATGGGSANSVERDSENGATWEVEITKPNGDTVDVRLDETYQVVVIEDDREATGGG